MGFSNQKELYLYSLSTEKTEKYFPRFKERKEPGDSKMHVEAFGRAELQAQIDQMSTLPASDSKDID
eukprot:11966265-Alexandrium_andersonii.AAC.1